MTLENVVKNLINKLIERDSSNHGTICEFIKEINE